MGHRPGGKMQNFETPTREHGGTWVTLGLAMASDKTPKARSMAENINAWDFVNIQNFCSVKSTLRDRTDNPQTEKKILAKLTSDKGLCGNQRSLTREDRQRLLSQHLLEQVSATTCVWWTQKQAGEWEQLTVGKAGAGWPDRGWVAN